jgi:hypothetical protein
MLSNYLKKRTYKRECVTLRTTLSAQACEFNSRANGKRTDAVKLSRLYVWTVSFDPHSETALLIFRHPYLLSETDRTMAEHYQLIPQLIEVNRILQMCRAGFTPEELQGWALGYQTSFESCQAAFLYLLHEELLDDDYRIDSAAIAQMGTVWQLCALLQRNPETPFYLLSADWRPAVFRVLQRFFCPKRLSDVLLTQPTPGQLADQLAALGVSLAELRGAWNLLPSQEQDSLPAVGNVLAHAR